MPRRVVCLDSEASVDFDGKRQEQTFLLAAASFDLLDSEAQPLAEPERALFETPAELWAWVAAHCSTTHRTVCFAHKLDYDLRLTCALQELAGLGFELRRFALGDYSSWFFLRRGGRSLYLVDSLSFLPLPLERLGDLVGAPARPRLRRNSSRATLARRCAGDVEALRLAMLELLRLLYEHDCGDFRTSGAGQASACFRHRFLEPRTLLCHDDLEALQAERRSAWAGRAEVWRHGRVEGPLYEWDLTAAYARVARDAMLPARLFGELFPATLTIYERARQSRRLLVEAEVELAEPILPCEHEGRIVWPVGRFTTTVWEQELELARSRGARVELRRIWAYEQAPLLRAWAEWIMTALAGGSFGLSPLGRLIAKEWSRALIGRFGLRYADWQYLGAPPEHGCEYYPVADLETGAQGWQLHVGRRIYEAGERLESPSSTPALMAAVMAGCRVELWKALEAAGEAHVCSLDTDGIVVDREGGERLEAAAAAGLLPGWRQKRRYERGVFRGPRNLELDEERRVSGVPRRAERLAPGLYRGEVWESLPAALRRRRADRVLVFERRFQVAERDPRRLHLAGGRTAPLELGR